MYLGNWKSVLISLRIDFWLKTVFYYWEVEIVYVYKLVCELSQEKEAHPRFRTFLDNSTLLKEKYVYGNINNIWN